MEDIYPLRSAVHDTSATGELSLTIDMEEERLENFSQPRHVEELEEQHIISCAGVPGGSGARWCVRRRVRHALRRDSSLACGRWDRVQDYTHLSPCCPTGGRSPAHAASTMPRVCSKGIFSSAWTTTTRPRIVRLCARIVPIPKVG